MNKLRTILTWGLLLAATHVMGYTITVSPTQIEAGQSTNLIINLNNTETNLTAYQMKLFLPTGVTVQKKANGKYAYTSNADRLDPDLFTVTVKDAVDGSVLIAVFSPDKDVIAGTSGELIRLPIDVASTVSTSLQGSIKEIEFTDVNNQAYNISNVNFTMTMPGSGTPDPGVVTGDVTVSVPDIAITAGSSTNLIINMQTDLTNLTAYQMKLYLPTGVTVQKKANGKYAYTSNADRLDPDLFTITVKDAADGSVLIAVFSPDKDVIAGTSGELIRLPIDVASTVTTSLQGSLKEIEFTDVNNQAYNISDVNFTMTMGGETSPNITFADPAVKALCVANWDTNHDGELSEAEAAAVADLGEAFRGNTTITSFNELQYFTSLTTIGNNAFDGCTSLTSIAIPTSLNRVKAEAFKNCTSLSKVIVTDIAAWCGIIYDQADEEWAPLGTFPLGLAQHLYSDENTEITEVVIPEGVTRIEPLAFRDAKYVTSVTIPNSVTYIGAQAFRGMHRLTSITIPQNVTILKEFTFNDCRSLTSFTIPEGVVNMEGNVFRDCTSLTSVSLPESLKTLGGQAFLGCRSLASITIPDGITFLDRIAFEGCSSLTTFTYNKAENALTKVNGVYQIGTAEDLCNFAILSTAANSDISAQLTADIDYTGYTFPSYNIGEHFQHIGLNGYCGTFDGNGHTITVNINNPDSWQVAALFRELGKGGVIKNLRVAGHVESVSKFSAGIVSNLKSGKVSHCVSDVDIVSHIDGDCTDGGIAGIATYDGQESIVEYCVVAGSFQGSNAHHRGGIIGIGYAGNSDNITIDNCLFLANVDGLDVTESGTFIRQPTDKTTINNCYYLNVLGTVTSGTQTTTAQMTSGELCFLLNGDQSNIDWTQNLTGDAVDSYPLPFSTHAQVYAYGNTYSNNDLSPIITFADANVKAICVANWDTNHDDELSEAEAAAVTDLGEVFRGNTTITYFNELQYFTGLTSIHDNAFEGCTNLTSIILPNGLITIGGCAFRSTAITSLTIPASVTYIAVSADSGGLTEDCTSLMNIYVEEDNSHYYSENGVLFSEDEDIIGANGKAILLFPQGRSGSYIIPSGVTVIAQRAFVSCKGLNSIVIPEGVTTIAGEYAFHGCSNLSRITIPSSMTNIGDGSFYNCSSISDVYCYAENVPNTNSNAFENSSISTATLHVPAASLEAYSTTVPWSGFGTIVAIEEEVGSNAIACADITAYSGHKVELPIMLTNDADLTVVGISFTLTLPEGVTVAKDEYGDPLYSLESTRLNPKRFNVYTNQYADGSWGFRISTNNTTAVLNGTEGEFMTITLDIADGMEEGDYNVCLMENKLSVRNSDNNIASKVISDSVSKLTINNVIMGDVNGDGEVDLSDAIMVTYYSLHVAPANFIEAVADVNGDGEIDLSDAITIIYKSLGVQ